MKGVEIIISLNKPNKILSIHKNNCKVVKSKISNIDLSKYPNGYYTGDNGNQVWFSEENFTLYKAQLFFKTDFGKVFCQRCFN